MSDVCVLNQCMPLPIMIGLLLLELAFYFFLGSGLIKVIKALSTKQEEK